MTQELTRLSFSFPDELKDELTEIADEEMRTLPNLIKMILDIHLERTGFIKKGDN